MKIKVKANLKIADLKKIKGGEDSAGGHGNSTVAHKDGVRVRGRVGHF